MAPDQAKALVDRVKALNERCRTGGAGAPAKPPPVSTRRRG
jgi:hypothetical protein